MRYLISTILIFFAAQVFAADLPISNAGFAPSNIWYSRDPFYAGESVRIYTVIFNSSTYDLTGAVDFLDNGVSVGKAKFSISHGGRAQDLWTDWKAGEGKHTITARLTDVLADGPNGKQAVLLPNTETGKNERVVDIDPAVKEAQLKAEAQKVLEARTQTVGKVEEVAQATIQGVPAPVREAVSIGVMTIEDFRLGEAAQLGQIKEQKIKEIGAIAERAKMASAPQHTTKNGAVAVKTESPNAAEKPFAYAMLAAVSVAQFAFEWRVVFYVVILYVLYRLIKWGVSRVRNSE